MRFIDKKKTCQEFDNFIINNKLDEYLDEYINDNIAKVHPWKKLDENAAGSEIKKVLTKHLYQEQKGLCIYCEQELNPDNKILSNYAHLEHLKPKEKNRYPELSFDYYNLTVSCNGFNCSDYSTEKEFCGHKKGSQYKDEKFLNPTTINDIVKFFVYTIEGKIKPSTNLSKEDKEKAVYMIKLLDLNNSVLEDMRVNSYNSFIEFTADEIDSLLSPKRKFYPGFYSMLKQFYMLND